MRDTSLDAYLDLYDAGEIAARQKDVLGFLLANKGAITAGASWPAQPGSSCAA